MIRVVEVGWESLQFDVPDVLGVESLHLLVVVQLSQEIEQVIITGSLGLEVLLEAWVLIWVSLSWSLLGQEWLQQVAPSDVASVPFLESHGAQLEEVLVHEVGVGCGLDSVLGRLSSLEGGCSAGGGISEVRDSGVLHGVCRG